MSLPRRTENGRKVIDRASFQSFGCRTAIAIASLATDLIRGKTADEALSLKSDDLSGELGPLPSMKIHCAELVEGALQAAVSAVSWPAVLTKVCQVVGDTETAARSAKLRNSRILSGAAEGRFRLAAFG